jgi:hypothetical protein
VAKSSRKKFLETDSIDSFILVDSA